MHWKQTEYNISKNHICASEFLSQLQAERRRSIVSSSDLCSQGPGLDSLLKGHKPDCRSLHTGILQKRPQPLAGRQRLFHRPLSFSHIFPAFNVKNTALTVMDMTNAYSFNGQKQTVCFAYVTNLRVEGKPLLIRIEPLWRSRDRSRRRSRRRRFYYRLHSPGFITQNSDPTKSKVLPLYTKDCFSNIMSFIF